MKERPILFSGEMVRAILSGRKTQTRRIVKAKGKIAVLQQSCGPMVLENYDDETNVGNFVRYQYGQPGDRLWVKETFWIDGDDQPVCFYAATDARSSRKLKPSIFMPRAASRITLEIVNVRVERLQDITEEDAQAEGCISTGFYKILWESINGAGSWAKNPWVWVIEFKKL